MKNPEASPQNRTRKIVTPLLLILALMCLGPSVQAQTTDQTIPLKNSRFLPNDGKISEVREVSKESDDGKDRYDGPVKDWRFEEKVKGASLIIPDDGQGVIFQADSETARGDFVSTPFKMNPFRWVDVLVEYQVETGKPVLFVCLRPADDPSLVDLAFLPKARKGKKKIETVRVHTGIMDTDYCLALAVMGTGSVRALKIEASEAGLYQRPDKPVFVLDITQSREPRGGRLEWDGIDKLVKVFGFPSIEHIHYSKFTAKKLKAIDPALVVLSPMCKKWGKADRGKVDLAIRRAVYFGVPVVGICFGHQLLAQNHGSGGTRICEWGVHRIDVKRKDPIFEGLPRSSHFYANEAHSYAVERAGKMLTLASSEKVDSQIFRYKNKPWYSFQARIEQGWEDSCPTTQLLWKNMFRKWGLLSERVLVKE
ncbi:MAG: glutamine amidotransferase-related protein [Planctomycetota bacterium]|jgi:GMP synthase-like glutamine amidotransferase